MLGIFVVLLCEVSIFWYLVNVWWFNDIFSLGSIQNFGLIPLWSASVCEWCILKDSWQNGRALPMCRRVNEATFLRAELARKAARADGEVAMWGRGPFETNVCWIFRKSSVMRSSWMKNDCWKCSYFVRWYFTVNPIHSDSLRNRLCFRCPKW